MSTHDEVVITGVGVVSPIGIGVEAFWRSLTEGVSGVDHFPVFDRDEMPVRIVAAVRDFEPKQYVKPRKSLKIMARDIQLGVSAARLAHEMAGLEESGLAAERLGVVFGNDMIPLDIEELGSIYTSCMVDGKFDFSRWGEHALAAMNPLWMLKFLPNMTACHITIAHDARGPNNTITLGEVSSLVAMNEAVRVIQRGQADVMISGGAFSRVHSTYVIRSFNSQQSKRHDDPAAASRPFDAQRDGLVNGEGAGAFVLERRDHAEARGATILARVLGFGNAFEATVVGEARQGTAIRASIETALRQGGLTAADLGHVNAHGLSTTEDDRLEAQAIRDLLEDTPVLALKSYFGNLGSGSGAVELAASVLSFSENVTPRTLNYEHPDPECPVNVIHGSAAEGLSPVALKLSQSPMGQAAALLVAAP